MMNQDIKRRWIEALQSGNFVQTTGKLRLAEDKDGKPQCCCLGVLCEILDAPKRLIEGDVAYTYNGDVQGILPEQVVLEAAVSFDGGYAPMCSLVNLNDSGYSFDAIAAVIEENF